MFRFPVTAVIFYPVLPRRDSGVRNHGKCFDHIFGDFAILYAVLHKGWDLSRLLKLREVILKNFAIFFKMEATY